MLETIKKHAPKKTQNGSQHVTKNLSKNGAEQKNNTNQVEKNLAIMEREVR